MSTNTITYSGTGTEVSLIPRGSSISLGFTSAIAIVGGYDSAEAAAGVTPNDASLVTDGSDASNTFGATSELARATDLAYSNGVGSVYGVPLEETENTETFTSTDGSGESFAETPVFDPRVHPDHDIVIEDTVGGTTLKYSEGDVTIDNSGTPSPPGTTDSAVVNTETGEWRTDSTSDYDITYTYGDYTSAIKAAVNVDEARFVAVQTSASSVVSTLASELDTRAANFDFKRGVACVTEAADPSSYTDSVDDFRVVLCAPARGTLADGGDVVTAAGFASMLASRPLGESVLYDEFNALDSVETTYTLTEASNFEEVTALKCDAKPYKVGQSVTTSTVEQFADVFQTEIIDTAALNLQSVAEEYAGGANYDGARENMASDMENVLRTFADQRPPLLYSSDSEQAYTVTVKEGSSDDIAVANIAIEPIEVMKEVQVNIGVGEVVVFEGVEV
jgi:hypothetical protein